MADIASFIDDVGIGALYGDYSGAYQLHHVKGRAFKHNKVAIGHEFVIPVPFELHDVHSNHPLNVTHFKKKFVAELGKQSEIFCRMLKLMTAHGYDTSIITTEIYATIMDTGA